MHSPTLCYCSSCRVLPSVANAAATAVAAATSTAVLLIWSGSMDGGSCKREAEPEKLRQADLPWSARATTSCARAAISDFQVKRHVRERRLEALYGLKPSTNPRRTGGEREVGDMSRGNPRRGCSPYQARISLLLTRLVLKFTNFEAPTNPSPQFTKQKRNIFYSIHLGEQRRRRTHSEREKHSSGAGTVAPVSALWRTTNCRAVSARRSVQRRAVAACSSVASLLAHRSALMLRRKKESLPIESISSIASRSTSIREQKFSLLIAMQLFTIPFIREPMKKH
ncbi:hypothetical protein PIB30_040962 [Stylosanthes scabra]|uniref:Secreted protein n=1 Tax=Stylosanthes scabra TaxID=79078 RepID=A0ABU6TFI7_9FABA|nr:hypothetical protein [Stylosanthes scabra]